MPVSERQRIPLPAVPPKKQYKARIEKPFQGAHSVEIYFEASNIIQAGNMIMDWFGELGVTADQITKLIEVE